MRLSCRLPLELRGAKCNSRKPAAAKKANRRKASGKVGKQLGRQLFDNYSEFYGTDTNQVLVKG